MPRDVCMDPAKAWFVDHRIGYRCRALQQVQDAKAKEDEDLTKRKIAVYPNSRKWTAVEFDTTQDQEPADGQDGTGEIPD